MKKKNGFISMTIIYSFIVLILLILLGITVFYSSNRILLRKSRNAIKSALIKQLENPTSGYIIINDYFISNGD